VAALGAGLGAALVAPGAGIGSTPSRCATANLRLEFVQQLGAAGARDRTMALRNVGPTTCVLRGYPGVGLLDGHAQLMTLTVNRAHRAVHTVTLSAWHRAFFTFHFESNGPCSSGVFPTGMQVYPPNATQALRIYQPAGICAGDHPAVTPVRATIA
jgi:hypothetical protein